MAYLNTASYLIGTDTIRFLNYKGQASSQWINNAVDPPIWTPEALKKRCEEVFNLAKGKLLGVALVNARQLPIECVEFAVNAASKFTDKVYVISPLMAILMYAIGETKLKFSNPSEKVLIGFFASEYCEIYEIKVMDSTCYGFVSARKCRRDNGEELLLDQTNKVLPSAVILLSSNDISPIKTWFEERYDGIIHLVVEKPDFMVRSGALAKTAALVPGFADTPMDIIDFANGFKVEYYNDYESQEVDLISFGQELPAKAIIELKNIRSLFIRHNDEFIVNFFDKKIVPKFKKQRAIVFETIKAGNYKITASINNYGIPHLNVDLQIDKTFLKNNPSLFKENKITIIIKLKANYGSICCKYNEKEIVLKNVNNNEWTPLYISFLNSKVVVGEKAIQDFQKKPEYVIADIHKIIGIPFDDIKFNPKWKFSLSPDPEDAKFATYELETFEGPRRVSPHFVMTLLLKALKRIAESELGIEIKNLNIQLSNAYSLLQFDQVKKAAETGGIKIDSIEYADFY